MSHKSGLGVSGVAPLEFRMLQLKPQERQGEGGDGCCSKPSLLGWEKSQRIWGAGPLHLHPAPAVSKWDPSSHIQQHLHRPAQHRSVTPATAAVPAKACGYGSNTFQPFTSWCPGTSPHPFVPAREFFAVSGRRHGAREEGVSASWWDRGKAGACQPSFHPDPSPEQLHILPGALGKGGER